MTELINLKMKVHGNAVEITNQQEFSLCLKTFRLRHGYTQEQVGKMFGCSRYTIMRCEAGAKLSWQTVYKISVKLYYAIDKELYEAQRK